MFEFLKVSSTRNITLLVELMACAGSWVQVSVILAILAEGKRDPKFMLILGFIVNLSPAWATRDPVSKKKKSVLGLEMQSLGSSCSSRAHKTLGSVPSTPENQG